MGRRLLFFSILRTRSAHKKLVGGSVIVLLGVNLVACESDGPELDIEKLKARAAAADEEAARAAKSSPSGSARRAEAELEALEIEAGIEPARDPSAPGGDLKRDLDEFTTLDACVKAHGIRDAVLGDAIDALGYDTLARDACRTLQALKAKDVRLCQPIAASPLRSKCETQVAVVAGEPALCPTVGNGAGATARDPMCLARANRDERFCAAVMHAERAVCMALVRGKASECGGDPACVRQVERFRSMLEKPAAHTPFPARLHVHVTGERGKSETYDAAFDLDEIAAAGAVARPLAEKTRFSIGSPKTVAWPNWDSPNAPPNLFLSVSVPSKMPIATGRGDAGPGVALGPMDLAFDLLIPRIALLSGMMASERRVVMTEATGAAGSPLRMTVTSKVSDGTRSFRVQIEVESFVRDGSETRGAGKRGL
ncbi:MAG: hypothetical protein ABW133_08240 [Polyangiaceae bacterium]